MAKRRTTFIIKIDTTGGTINAIEQLDLEGELICRINTKEIRGQGMYAPATYVANLLNEIAAYDAKVIVKYVNLVPVVDTIK